MNLSKYKALKYVTFTESLIHVQYQIFIYCFSCDMFSTRPFSVVCPLEYFTFHFDRNFPS